MAETEDVRFVVKGGVGWITLNRPRALNALTLEMIRRMTEMVTLWEAAEEVKLIVVVGEGERAFCSGGDVKSVAACRKEPDIQREFIQCEYRLDLLISRLSTPYISVWQGLVMGGGVGISRMGGLRIATERTVLAMPECGIGLIPDVGAGHFLPLLPGHLGLFLGLTGHRVGGWECYKFGLATHYVMAADIPEILQELPRHCENEAKLSQFLQSYQQSKPSENNPDILSENLEEINDIFSQGSLEEIIEKLKSSPSEFSSKAAGMLDKCSPTSLHITFHQLKDGSPTYQEALQVEYRLMSRRFLDPDFYEGVRAALVDKDHLPVWTEFSGDSQQYFDKLDTELQL